MANITPIEAKAGKIAVKQSRKTRNAAADAKTRRQAKKVMESLREAEQIHKGKKKGKSFDEFLEEL